MNRKQMSYRTENKKQCTDKKESIPKIAILTFK